MPGASVLFERIIRNVPSGSMILMRRTLISSKLTFLVRPANPDNTVTANTKVKIPE